MESVVSWCKCGNCGPADFLEARAAGACHMCWLQRWHPYAVPPIPVPRAPDVAKAERRKQIDRVKTPCVHRSAEPIGKSKSCGACDLYACALHQECTTRECMACPDYATEIKPHPPGWPILFDHTNLAPGRIGKRFNASIIDDGDGFILAYRDGWENCEIHTIRLDRDFRPIGEPVLADMRTPWKRTKGPRPKWRCPGAEVGREDPRLFRFKGQLHVAFVGYDLSIASQCYARLNEDRTVAEAWQANVPERRKWEKNHSFFEHDGQLYAVYLSHPRHIVVKVEGDREIAMYDQPNTLPWDGGEIRGGAPPVRVGDVYWHFFHDRIDQPNGRFLYRTGLLEFDGKPPFATLRMVREPIQEADTTTQPLVDPNYCDVLFVGGAVRVGDDWILCSGEHDRRIRIDRFAHADLDRLLKPADSKRPFSEIMAAEAWMMMLPRHAHRAEHSRQRLAEVGFRNVVMVPGVDGWREDAKAIAAASGWRFLDSIAAEPGSMGYTISMFRMFQRIVDEDREFAVLFEDDALPHPQFAALAEEWWAETPQGFDIVYLGNQIASPGNTKVSTVECFLTHAMIVSRKGAEKILDLIHRHVFGPLDKGDILLIRYQQQRLIRHYAWLSKTAPPPAFAPGDSPWPRDTGLICQNFSLGSSIHAEAIDFR